MTVVTRVGAKKGLMQKKTPAVENRPLVAPPFRVILSGKHALQGL